MLACLQGVPPPAYEPAEAHDGQADGYGQPAAYSEQPAAHGGQSHGQRPDELQPAAQAAEPRVEMPPASPRADVPWTDASAAQHGDDACRPAGGEPRRPQRDLDSQIQPAPNGGGAGGVKRPAEAGADDSATAGAGAGQKQAQKSSGQQPQQPPEKKAKQCCGCCIM